MQFRFWLLALQAVGLFSATALAVESSPPAAPERLVMPYSCAVESGAVVTRPGPERTFLVFDGRQQKLFTTCDPPFSNNCRSITVHRFDMSCGSERVPWVRVVASIRRTAAGSATLSKGHLVLARRSMAPTGSAPSCADRQSSIGVAAPGECLPWRVARATEQMVLPEGYAPTREVGARFVGGSTPSEWTAAQLLAGRTGISSSGPVRADERRHDLLLTGETLPDVTLADLSSPPPDNAEQWVTTTRDTRDLPPAQNARASSASHNFAPWIALFGCLALAGAYLARSDQLRLAVPMLSGALAVAARRAREAQDLAMTAFGDLRERMRAPPPATLLDDSSVGGELAEAKALLTRTEASIAALGSATVLREVMESELTGIRAKLSAAEETARNGAAPVMKLRAQFRVIAREIERVERIAESAASSIGGPVSGIRMPVTVSEAYEVLGVDAGVSDAVLALRVEALRHALHTGLAKNDGDRVLRETQSRLLATAWDIVSRSRAGAG